jgi:dTDP-4-amino-4,6-dideoxygalactose transaminase
MAKLAINGGTPVAPGGLKTTWPIYDDCERKALIDVLESGKWCSARFYYEHPLDSRVALFQQEFARWIGCTHAVAAANGTSAVMLALKAAGITTGDEVICPAATFIATATAVIMAGGVPVFVDIEPDTYQMDPALAEQAITPRTKALLPVHYGGYPADMDRIMDVARRHNLVVIEDAAEAHGTEWRGKKTGNLGHAGAFSFQMGKPLAAGEGGAVTTSDPEIARMAYSYLDLGRIEDGGKYEHYIAAGNNRMTEFQGAILLCALKRLDEQTNIRWQNGEYFAQELDRIGGIPALKRDPRITKRGYYFYFLRYQPEHWGGMPRSRFLQALAAEGIHAGTAHNQPLYQNPMFLTAKWDRGDGDTYRKAVDYSKVSCPVAERVFESEVVALGKDFLMERALVDQVLEAIGKIKANLSELV